MSQARVTAVFLAQERETPMKRVDEALAVEGRGLEGDRHAKKQRRGGKRQVLLMDAQNLRALGLPEGVLKENVVVDAMPVPLEELPPGQRLRLGEAVVELTEQCVPCHKLERIRPGLLKESWGRRGQLARVIGSGVIREGDSVVLLDVNPDAPKPIRPKLP